MGAAYTAVAAVDLPRREVYVLTDLAASQWQTGQEVEGLAQATKSLKNGKIDTFVLRVSAKDVRDVAIVSAEPASPVATEDDPLVVKVKLRNVGPKAKRIVELRIDDIPDPIANKAVDLPANSELDVPELATPKLKGGLHRLEVRLQGEPDPMDFDDVRYLTVDVQPAIKILLLSDTAIDAEFVAQALDPPRASAGPAQAVPGRAGADLAARGEARRQVAEALCRHLPAERRGARSGVVEEAPRLRRATAAAWSLRRAAGRRRRTTTRASPTTSCRRTWTRSAPTRRPTPASGSASPTSAARCSRTNQKELMAELALVPIYKSWAVTPEKGHVQTLLQYIDESPALMEKTFPGPRPGKVLLWTTPLARRPLQRRPRALERVPVHGVLGLPRGDEPDGLLPRGGRRARA